MASAGGKGVRSWSPVRNNEARAIKPGKRPNSSPVKNFHHILVIPQKLNTGVWKVQIEQEITFTASASPHECQRLILLVALTKS